MRAGPYSFPPPETQLIVIFQLPQRMASLCMLSIDQRRAYATTPLCMILLVFARYCLLRYVSELKTDTSIINVQIHAPSRNEVCMTQQLILIAGPWRSGTDGDQAKMNESLARLENAALAVYQRGHVPVIGEWLALPLAKAAGSTSIGDEISEAM